MRAASVLPAHVDFPPAALYADLYELVREER